MSVLDLFKLEGKKAFVTGGARGIGKCAAMTFAEVGADVAVVDIIIDQAVETAEEISRTTGTHAIAIKCDVTDPAEVNKMAEIIIKEYGTVDIAFNNAGTVDGTKAEEVSAEAYRRIIDVNQNGIFLTAQAAGKIMIAQRKGGSIINTASISGHIVNVPQTQVSYNASKAAVLHITKSLAIEWAKYNIRVNSISPGYIATEIVKTYSDMFQFWVPRIPMERFGTPEELRAGILYLASDASTYTTGTDLIMDGGYTSI